MLVCAPCKKEMKCIKTGMVVRYREDCAHGYAADLYECPECKARIASCVQAPHYDPDALDHIDEHDVLMDRKTMKVLDSNK